jgi:hypothetical protein
MDGHILTAFKIAIESITDDMLPMNTSVFTSKYLHPYATTKLNFKKSNFKKISVFLK